MHSLRLEATKLILIRTRTTYYQATGGATKSNPFPALTVVRIFGEDTTHCLAISRFTSGHVAMVEDTTVAPRT